MLAVYAVLSFAVPARAEGCVYNEQIYIPAAGEVARFETCGGDDSSYTIPLSTPIVFDGVEYSTIYATTNSVISFGRPDNTYWDFPNTPSISIMSMDWVSYPSISDEHLIITVSDAGFQIDLGVRPYGNQGTPDVTNITVTAIKQTNGSYSLTYSIEGKDWSNEVQLRTGARLHNGSIVSLEEAGFTQVTEPPVVPPTPVDPTPDPRPTPEPTVDPTPEPTVEPTVEPTPEPTVEPTPDPTPTTDPTPEPTIKPTPEPTQEPTPEEPKQPVITQPADAEQEPVITPGPVTEPPVASQPTVDEVVAEQIALAEADDIEVPEELAAIPVLGNVAVALADAANYISNVGADLTPEQRKKSQKVIVSAVIVGQVAQLATAAAAGTRRSK